MLIDTSVLVALADAADPHHESSRRLLDGGAPRLVPEPVVTEADYLITRLVGPSAEEAFLTSIVRRSLPVELPTQSDRERGLDLVIRYRDLGLGYVDSITVAIAERLGEDTIATLDHRHFRVVRPQHVAAFTLVP